MSFGWSLPCKDHLCNVQTKKQICHRWQQRKGGLRNFGRQPALYKQPYQLAVTWNATTLMESHESSRKSLPRLHWRKRDFVSDRDPTSAHIALLVANTPSFFFTYFQDLLLGMITLKYQNHDYTFHLKIYNSAQQLKSLLIPSCSLWDLWHPADQKWFIPIEFQKRKKYFPKCQVSTSYKFRQFTGGSDHMMVEQAVIRFIWGELDVQHCSACGWK